MSRRYSSRDRRSNQYINTNNSNNSYHQSSLSRQNTNQSMNNNYNEFYSTNNDENESSLNGSYNQYYSNSQQANDSMSMNNNITNQSDLNEINVISDNSPPTYHATISNQNSIKHNNYNSFKMNREEKYREIIFKHEISNEFADRLQQLQGFKIVFIFDDSGSMNTVLQDSPLNTVNTLFKATRWDELQCFANISIEIASLFDPNGCDIYFLNRVPSPVRNVRKPSDLLNHFNLKPNGFTPLARVLENVLADNSPPVLNEKKLLIIVATDGEPTDDTGKTAISQFKRCLLNRGPNVFTTIVVCTDDDESVNYLNKWDRAIPNLDVIDDYRNERLEIKKVKGSNFHFSFGDYVVKSLVGAIDPELDKMDESSCCLSF